jgi:hypothetical protein
MPQVVHLLLKVSQNPGLFLVRPGANHQLLEVLQAKTTALAANPLAGPAVPPNFPQVPRWADVDAFA